MYCTHQKWIAVLLSVMLLVLALAGCGKRPSGDEAQPSSPSLSLRESEADWVVTDEDEPSRQHEEDLEEETRDESLETATPSSAVEQVAAQPASTAEGKQIPNLSTPIGEYSAFELDPNTGLYYTINGDFTCTMADHDKVPRFTDAINNLNNGLNGGMNPGSPNPGATSEGGYMVVMPDYSKMIYNLVRPVLIVNDMDYLITEEQFDALKGLSSDWGAETYPQWLVYMNPNRVTGITFQEGDTPETFCQEYVSEAAPRLQFYMVQKGSGKTFTGALPAFVPGDDKYEIKLTFDNGIHYTIRRDKTTLYVASSDMGYGCSYTLADGSQADYVADLFLNPENYFNQLNPSTGKPVIYLYPEKTQDISVTLDFDGRLSYTYPAYNDGWNVTAQPDGTLTNRPDGSTHYYLFWDGFANRDDWDFSEGFLVKGNEVESFLRETLPKLGLTPREYNDFITYWTPEMAPNAYNLVTFSTTQYEETAKLNVSPSPDTVIRVHMVYRPVQGPVSIQEQKLPEAPPRLGFTVVEWGGTRA